MDKLIEMLAIAHFRDRDACLAVIRTLEAEGWRIVPVELTEDMLKAGDDVVEDQFDFYDPGRFNGIDDAWPAMLAAAPRVLDL